MSDVMAGAGGALVAAAGEPAMAPFLARALGAAALAVGVTAASILLLGVVRGLVLFLGGEIGAAAARRERLDSVRSGLGQYLLLGLELLVAADVLETILTPSLDHVLALAGVVVIRTVIGFSLNWELARHQQHGQRAAATIARRVP